MNGSGWSKRGHPLSLKINEPFKVTSDTGPAGLKLLESPAHHMISIKRQGHWLFSYLHLQSTFTMLSDDSHSWRHLQDQALSTGGRWACSLAAGSLLARSGQKMPWDQLWSIKNFWNSCTGSIGGCSFKDQPAQLVCQGFGRSWTAGQSLNLPDQRKVSEGKKREAEN